MTEAFLKPIDVVFSQVFGGLMGWQQVMVLAGQTLGTELEP